MGSVRTVVTFGFEREHESEPDPPETDENWDSVVLLMGFDGKDGSGAIFDESARRHGVSGGRPVLDGEVDTGQAIVGDASAYLPNEGGDRASVEDSDDWTPGDDYTWDIRVRFETLSGLQEDIFAQWQSSTGLRGYIFRYDHSNERLEFLYSTTGGDTNTLTFPVTLSADTDYHIRVVKQGTTLTVSLDGEEIGNDTIAADLHNPGQAFSVGNHQTGTGNWSNGLQGWADEVRLTKGVALATEYTPPEGKWPRQDLVDGAFSWWNHPLALSESGYIYLCHAGTDGVQRVSKIHEASGAIVETVIVGTAYGLDGHNAPAVVRMADGNLLVAYTGHLEDSTWRYRIGADVGSLGAEQTLAMSGTTTYVQLFARGNSVYWLGRVDGTGGDWTLRISTDNGANWGSEVDLATRSGSTRLYVLGRHISADVVRFLATGLGGSTDNPIKVFELDLSTGSVTSGGTSLGNLDGSAEGGNTLPADWDDLVTLFTPSVGESTRLLDLADDGEGFLYARFDGAADEYWRAELTGADYATPGDWTHKAIVATGDPFRTTNDYFGGAVFDRAAGGHDTLYVAREDAGTWRVERRVTADGGDNWTVDEEIDTGADPTVRPLSVGDWLAWQQGPYTDYDDHYLATRWA